jgi:hypothetical protein
MSGELDGGTEERGGERIDGNDQNIVTTQLKVPARERRVGGCGGRARGSEQEGDQRHFALPR